MSDAVILTKISDKLDTVGADVTTLTTDVAVLKRDVSEIPNTITAAIDAHTLNCINRKVKEKVDSPMSPKLIATLVGAVVALAGIVVTLVKALN